MCPSRSPDPQPGWDIWVSLFLVIGPQRERARAAEGLGGRDNAEFQPEGSVGGLLSPVKGSPVTWPGGLEVEFGEGPWVTPIPAGVPGGSALGRQQHPGGGEGAEGERQCAGADAVPGGGTALQVGGTWGQTSWRGRPQVCVGTEYHRRALCPHPSPLLPQESDQPVAVAGPCSTATCSSAWPSAPR
jgi:hypothetical protein